MPSSYREADALHSNDTFDLSMPPMLELKKEIEAFWFWVCDSWNDLRAELKLSEPICLRDVGSNFAGNHSHGAFVTE